MKITGQVIYMGPHIRSLGLGYGTIFLDGIHPHLYNAIAKCRALGELFVPVDKVALVRRELAFDYAHNMLGTTGKHVTFYREVQKWLASTKAAKQSPSGVTIESQHA
jgi:hypothetical protein